MRSLNARITVSAAIVLAIFVALSALALEKAFRDSARNAREERLLAQIYLLMAAAEVDVDGTLRVANRSAEPRLGLPDSGLYAFIVDGNGETVWQSRSGLVLELPPTPTLAAGRQTFTQTTHGGERYLAKAYGINWTTDNGSYPFTFSVIEDSSPFDEQLNVYRRSLWTWLSAMAALLLISQWAALRWGLAPLRHVSNELNRLEAGEQHRISGRYPSEVQRLADNLNAVLSHERKQQQRYRNALADLAHSLKTPLALVRGTARDAQLLDAQSIEQQVDQMDRIIGYHLQRAAASGRSTLATPVELAPRVQRIVAALKKVYSDKEFQIIVDVDSEMRFRGDEGDLTEMLGNLLDNACKWCRETVRISASSDQERLQIRVEDDGPGIQDADAARVFMRGARTDETVPGHGIGLAVVREIVEAYGGDASISKSALGGTMVELRFPEAQ
ncbi:MAG: GHKL domain-containing protein [Betaproteobacteria bacterium]|nr:MAG: GHKL domain-containing protein [Betaproteobacteria bacterium]